MDLDKIKEFILEKKVYIIAIAILGIGGFFYFQSANESSVDNSDLVSEQVSQENTQTSSSSSSTNAVTTSQSKQDTVTCDITGAVKEPGVYTLKNGSRLNDLLKAAGGATKRAQLKSVNRALLLKDQDQFYIPHQGEKVENVPTAGTSAPSASSTAGVSSTSSNGEKVNLNTATVQDLQKLSGIGEKRAEQIISYREQNGGFKSIEDLTNISGIGEKTLEKLKNQLVL